MATCHRCPRDLEAPGSSRGRSANPGASRPPHGLWDQPAALTPDPKASVPSVCSLQTGPMTNSLCTKAAVKGAISGQNLRASQNGTGAGGANREPPREPGAAGAGQERKLACHPHAPVTDGPAFQSYSDSGTGHAQPAGGRGAVVRHGEQAAGPGWGACRFTSLA